MRMKGIVPQVRQFTIAIQPILALLLIGWLAACRRDNRAGAVLSPQRAPSVFVRLTY
jgi:hypothetical protein